MRVRTIKFVREGFGLSEMQMAEHLGVTKHALQCYERGNLEVPVPISRLLVMLEAEWLEHGYKSPEEMWGKTK